MQIIVSSTLRVKDPTPEFKKWCKDNLSIPNPEYTKKLRMHFWVGNTPKVLSLYSVDGNDLILPFGTLRDLPQSVRNTAGFTAEFQPKRSIDFGGADTGLYDYQQEAVNAAVLQMYGIIQSPAGSGKTQMGIELIKRLKVKTLWLTHTLDLLRQSKERAEQYIDKDLMGTITEGKVNIGSGVTFATIQTMSKLNLNEFKDTWDLVIVDECHRVAGTPTAMTQFYKVLNSLAARHKYGLSATVHRSDGMIVATYALLGKVIHEVPPDAVADKIMKVGIYPADTRVGISSSCMNSDGTLNYAKLITYLTTEESRNKYITQCIEENRGLPSLILSDRLEHLTTLMNMLPEDMRKDAVMVSGKMVSKAGKAEREQAMDDMRTGRKKYLFATYSLAKEGLDIPRLERLFLTTPQKDYAVVTQSIGRIARTFEGKGSPIAYDFVDNINYLIKSYKKRCTTYKKANCYWLEGGSA